MRDRCSSAWHVSERAKLYSAGSGQRAAGSKSLQLAVGGRSVLRAACSLLAACCLLPASACARDRVTPVYDPAGTIRRLDYDTDRDGRIDMRAYLENGRTVRIEADGNGDGVVDRWEYYRADGQLDRLGTSSESDGVEDTWVVQSGDQRRGGIATRPDGGGDPHECHDKGAPRRAPPD